MTSFHNFFLHVYPVKVSGGDVYVDLGAAGPAS